MLMIQSAIGGLVEGRGLLRQHQRRDDAGMHGDDELHSPGERNSATSASTRHHARRRWSPATRRCSREMIDRAARSAPDNRSRRCAALLPRPGYGLIFGNEIPADFHDKLPDDKLLRSRACAERLLLAHKLSASGNGRGSIQSARSKSRVMKPCRSRKSFCSRSPCCRQRRGERSRSRVKVRVRAVKRLLLHWRNARLRYR